MRERLESLCRELQRQNKMLMVIIYFNTYLFFIFSLECTLVFVCIVQGECKRVSTEGQNMRQELSERFNNAIKVWIYLVYFL